MILKDNFLKFIEKTSFQKIISIKYMYISNDQNFYLFLPVALLSIILEFSKHF